MPEGMCSEMRNLGPLCRPLEALPDVRERDRQLAALQRAGEDPILPITELRALPRSQSTSDQRNAKASLMRSPNETHNKASV